MRYGWMLCACLALGTVACSDRAEDGTPNVSEAPTASDQPENPQDREVIAMIRRDLVADQSLSMRAQNVMIVSDGGDVTLRGQVESTDEKSRIEETARKTPGVEQIDNQIEVAQ